MKRGAKRALILFGIAWFARCQPAASIEQLEDLRRVASASLIETLARETPERRARAALAMGRIQSTSYLESLVAATHDGDRSVRLAALFALGQLGLAKGADVPAAAGEACRRTLDDPDPEVVAAAVEALGKLAGPEVPDTVRPLLGHAEPAVRREAAMALFRHRFVPLWREQADEPLPLPAAAVDDLAKLLEDPVAEVRRAAAHAFSRYGQPEAVAALVAALDDGDALVRLFAARAIGRSGVEAAAPEVLEATGDPSAGVRTEAVSAVAALGRAASLDGALADDPSHHVRAALAAALAGRADAASLAVLRRLERDDSPTVRTAAVAALAERLGRAYASELASRLDDPDWRIRAAAAAAAAHAGDAARSLVDRALEDEDSRVRTAALASLDGMGRVEEPLAAALASDDLAVRGTAVTLLAERDDAGKLAKLTAAYDASSGVAWIEIREALVDAVAGLDGAEALLRRMADDPAPSVGGKARLALEADGIHVPVREPVETEPSPFLGTSFDTDPVVVLETTKGTIVIRCLARRAPIHVASFVRLVREGFYDGLIWHRVVPNFVIQGGDPRGDGWGSAGYTLRDEIGPERFARGTVGMPKAGKDTGGCQIFITHVPTPHLDGNYTVFGRVVSGLDVVDRIEVGDEILRATVGPPA